MTEKSYFWQDSTVGDASLAPYDQEEFSEIFRCLLNYNNTAAATVISGYLNELATSFVTGDTIRVASGAAIVDGNFYKSTASEDFNVTRGGAPATQLIVLQKIWTGGGEKTVRLALLAPGAAVTQTDGTKWEVPIATANVPVAGAVTFTDSRRYLHSNGNHIARAIIASDTTHPTSSYLEATPYTPRQDHTMMCGSIQWTGAAASSGNVVVAFTNTYTEAPMAVVTPASAFGPIGVSVVPTAGDLTIYWQDLNSVPVNRTAITFYWIAYGRRRRGQ